MESHNQQGQPTKGAWMALIAALLGWLFDGAEMGLFSMVGNAAVADLLSHTGREHQSGTWFAIIIATFLVGAATGGVLFGWLGDRMGRVRAMSLSVLVYALFTGFCGLTQTVEQLAAMRFMASLGMGGEWSLGVALVMEVWPNRSRAFMAGLIGAAANVGYLLVGVVGLVLDAMLHSRIPELLGAFGLESHTIAWLTAHKGWRLMMMLGTTPALLTFLIRLFVPESHRWQEEQRRGTTSHWMALDLSGVLIGVVGAGFILYVWAYDISQFGLILIRHTLLLRVGITLLGLVIALLGYLYPVWCYLQRSNRLEAVSRQLNSSVRHVLSRMILGAALSGVALLGTWGSTQWAPRWAGELTKNERQSREWTQIYLAAGAVTGTILAALAGDWLGRKVSYAFLCLLALLSAEYLYYAHHHYNHQFLLACFLAGACTASFYGWLPLYLPELFTTRVRATGQGFSFNFGRILAAIGVLQTGVLVDRVFAGNLPRAGMLMSLIYLCGLLVIAVAPETRGKPLPE